MCVTVVLKTKKVFATKSVAICSPCPYLLHKLKGGGRRQADSRACGVCLHVESALKGGSRRLPP